MQNTTDVLIAGAGPVGLFAANCLAKTGVSLQIHDPGVWPCSHSYALALHPRTVEILGRAGISPELMPQASAIHRVAVYDGRERRVEIPVVGASGSPMLVVPQSTLEARLEDCLKARGVKVQWRQKVMRVDQTAGHTYVALNKYEKESGGYVISSAEWVLAKSWTADASYVIGADGYDSAVRRSCGIAFPEVAPCSWYAVYEFWSEADISSEVRVMLGDLTTDVLWPLGGGRFRWSFQLPGYQDAAEDRWAQYRHSLGDPAERHKERTYSEFGDTGTLPDSRLTELIEERAPWFTAGITEVGWRTIVRFERRLASRFGQARCWLAGDAAHLGSPVGVQSLNSGIAEAFDLSAALVEALAGHPEGLDRYDAEYRSEWQRLQGMTPEAEPSPGEDEWLRKNRQRLIPCLPAHGKDLSALAARAGLEA